MAVLGKLSALILGVALVLLGLGVLRIDASGFQSPQQAPPAVQPEPAATVTDEPVDESTVDSELHPGETLVTDTIDDTEQIELLTERLYELETRVDLICSSGVYTNQNGPNGGAILVC